MKIWFYILLHIFSFNVLAGANSFEVEISMYIDDNFKMQNTDYVEEDYGYGLMNLHRYLSDDRAIIEEIYSEESFCSYKGNKISCLKDSISKYKECKSTECEKMGLDRDEYILVLEIETRNRYSIKSCEYSLYTKIKELIRTEDCLDTIKVKFIAEPNG